MIAAADISAKLKEVPFQPFRIVTSSGEQYEVHHPDGVYVTRRVLYVGIFQKGVTNVPDQAATVSILHISDLQPVVMNGTP